MRMSKNQYYETWNEFVECSEMRKAYGTMYRPKDYEVLKDKLLMEVKIYIEWLSYEKKVLEKESVNDLEMSKKLTKIMEIRDRLEKLEIMLVVSPEDISVDDFADTYVYKSYHFVLRLFVTACFMFFVWLLFSNI